GGATVVGALNHLAEPAARLRRIYAVRISRRTLQVVDVPACEVRSADVPALAAFVRRHHESALMSSNQQSYRAHSPSCPMVVACVDSGNVRNDNRTGVRSRQIASS